MGGVDLDICPGARGRVASYAIARSKTRTCERRAASPMQSLSPHETTSRETVLSRELSYSK